MSVRRVALIDLPPGGRDRLAALLPRLGLEIYSTDWRDGTDPNTELIVGSSESFIRHLKQDGVVPERAWSRVVLLAPETQTALLLEVQIRYHLFNVLPNELLSEPDCLARVLGGLLAPCEMFDLARHLPNPAVSERLAVTTLAEKHQIAEELAALIRPYVTEQRRMRDFYLIVNELINNAFFHSFRDLEGEQKYSPRAFSRLDEGDQVSIHVAASGEGVAVAVEDNRGSLSPAEVLRYLLRQTSGEGVYDSHGRGFYLVSHLVHHLSICLEPDRRTRIISLTHNDPARTAQTLDFFVASE